MMTDRDPNKVERFHRITFPTASFSLTVAHIQWIAARALRLGVSKSQVMRDVLDKAIREDEEAAA